MEGTEECRGINWRTLSSLFGQRDERKGDITYDFSLSMLEIYNEVSHTDAGASLLAHSGSYKHHWSLAAPGVHFAVAPRAA